MAPALFSKRSVTLLTTRTTDLLQRGDTLDASLWHPFCRQLFDYWRSLPPADPALSSLPGRDKFDPIAVRGLLPYIIMLDVQAEPLRFRLRLVGTMMTTWLRQDPTGRWLDELSGDITNMHERLAWVVQHGQPSWRHGSKRIGPGRDYGSSETLALPLAGNGAAVDRLLCIGMVYNPDGQPVLR